MENVEKLHYVKSGSSIRPIGSLKEVSDHLDPLVYEVKVVEMVGTFLEIVENLDQSVPPRIYGNNVRNVEKSFAAFNRRPLNTGILLSGDRGMGKTLFIRMCINKALSQGIPVINLKYSDNIDEIISIINRISQPLLVVMDEFEKNFELGKDQSAGDQMPFLSMLDGLGSGEKRMFIASVNDTYKLSQFMINRPGRFYYHFEFKKLNDTEMTEFLKNEVAGLTEDQIQYAVSMLSSYSINYDGISAIAAELNAGCTIDETLRDLNLDREGCSSLMFRVNINGFEFTGYNGFDSLETIRRRTSFSVDFYDRRPIMSVDDKMKPSKKGYIGSGFTLYLSPVEMEVSKNGSIILKSDNLNYISLDDPIPSGNGEATTDILYKKDLKSISNITVTARSNRTRPLYIDV